VWVTLRIETKKGDRRSNDTFQITPSLSRKRPGKMYEYRLSKALLACFLPRDGTVHGHRYTRYKPDPRIFSPSGSRRRVLSQSAVSDPKSAQPQRPRLEYEHVLLPVLDANSYLSDGTKLALKTATLLAQNKVTVLVVDEEVSWKLAVLISMLTWHHGVIVHLLYVSSLMLFRGHALA